ncbi:uncharacterized protein LOC129598133 [Paramacrobiotus metropolitanus]|uniref:uncharacterized protein LOC129598133 n=1 Tax=Paramacrobiotus metropolitanus TaxID=2943436 RepID=UPI0024462016|nr:uncharacterized protein LOC129598133 [Paramacrobiotus metropolitanus]
MDKEPTEPTSNSSQGSRSSRGSQQGADLYKIDLHPYTRPVAHERNTRAPKVPVKKDSRGSDATYQKALEAVSAQESSSDDQKRAPASAAGGSEVNQQEVTTEGRSSGQPIETEPTSQKDVEVSPAETEQDKEAGPAKPNKKTEMELNELSLDDLSLNEDITLDDLFESPMSFEEMMRSDNFNRGNETYFTNDDTTMHMSFHTAMKEADRAQGLTPFKDIPEHLIERNQIGKIVNVRSPSPNSPTSNMKTRIRELERSLEEKEGQVLQKKEEYRNRLGSLEARIYELEQHQGVLESSADEWKIRYERQKQIAEESEKIADDREMEGIMAMSDLNESMSEETAERSRHLAELRDRCDELKQKVIEAESKRDEYAKNLTDLTQRLTTGTTEIHQLRKDLKLRDESIETLRNEFQAHQKRADEAIQAAKELTDLTATEELLAMTTTAMANEDEATTLKGQLKRAADAFTELDQQVETLKDVNKQKESRMINLENYAHRFKQERDQLKKEKAELIDRVKRLEDENKGL